MPHPQRQVPLYAQEWNEGQIHPLIYQLDYLESRGKSPLFFQILLSLWIQGQGYNHHPISHRLAQLRLHRQQYHNMKMLELEL